MYKLGESYLFPSYAHHAEAQMSKLSAGYASAQSSSQTELVRNLPVSLPIETVFLNFKYFYTLDNTLSLYNRYSLKTATILKD